MPKWALGFGFSGNAEGSDLTGDRGSEEHAAPQGRRAAAIGFVSGFVRAVPARPWTNCAART